jgi:hypothetical protein
MTSRTCPRWIGFATVATLLFVIYNANGRDILVGDPITSTLLPHSLLFERDLDLDEFDEILEWDYRIAHRINFLGAVQERDGHRYSSYPVGASIVALPVYALLAPFAGDSWLWLRLLGKLSASLAVALSAAVLFLAIRRVAGERAAWSLSLAYGLGTVAWPVASQALWQHGPGMLCLSVAVAMAVRLEEADEPRHAAAAMGAALGLAVICRLFNLIPALVLAVFVVFRHRRHAVAFGLPAALCAAWLLWYNVATFGELVGGHFGIHTWLPRGQTKEGVLDLFTTPIWIGLPGLLVSPSKGFFVHSSFALLALPAAVAAWRAQDFALGRYLCVWIALMLCVLGVNGTWWGGGSYGTRYMCELLPPLMLLLAFGWRQLESAPRSAKRRLATGFFAVSLAVSIALQALGAFVHPCGWEVRVRVHQQRLWDLADTEIARCIQLAAHEGARPAEFTALFR